MSDFLCPDFIKQCAETVYVSTKMRRKLPVEMAVWTIICMSFYREDRLWSIVSKLGLALPGKKSALATTDEKKHSVRRHSLFSASRQTHQAKSNSTSFTLRSKRPSM
ncbi:transposase domain-containing protein [Colwellia chukchiensis]|uniref:transposase domain-containing protein n=1 Tax=Colwellia chukchiensis TaxID=641665 RepID=UPI000C790076